MKSYIKSAFTIAALTVGLAACSGGPDTPVSGSAADATSHPATKGATSADRGAVQRNYPSASEEAALKLDYPLFLPYGADSARLTAFFPGASERPVSVKLSPNEAGYSLVSEGSECTFPLVYELKSVDGQLMANGEYKGTASTLAGWAANKGVAVLSVHMADGAKNNYGCNVVVTKK